MRKERIDKSVIANSIASIFFVCFLIFFMLTVFFQFILKNVFIEKYHIQNSFTDLCTTGSEKGYTEVEINWNDYYPIVQEFTTDSDTGTNISGNPGVSVYDKYYSEIGSYINKIKSAEDNIDKYTKDFLMYSENIQAISGFFDLVTGNRMLGVDNTYYTDGNGRVYIYNPFDKESEIDEEYIYDTIQPVVELGKFLNEKEIPFVYVQTPLGNENNSAELESIIGTSGGNIKCDLMLDYFENNGVDCLDLRKSVVEQNIDVNTLFPNTEGHWNANAGMWASEQVAIYLKDNYGFSFDEKYFDKDNYSELVYKDWLQGDKGRTLTLARMPYEDLTFYLPDFETNYELSIPSLEGIPTSGSFDEIMFNYSALRRRCFYTNSYGAMLYLKPDLLMLHNLEFTPNEGVKILLIRESYSSVIVPYLSTQYEYIDAITPQRFNGSIKSYIEATKPDAVIVLYTLHISDEWYDIK